MEVKKRVIIISSRNMERYSKVHQNHLSQRRDSLLRALVLSAPLRSLLLPSNDVTLLTIHVGEAPCLSQP